MRRPISILDSHDRFLVMFNLGSNLSKSIAYMHKHYYQKVLLLNFFGALAYKFHFVPIFSMD